jgi:hypothetical protein
LLDRFNLRVDVCGLHLVAGHRVLVGDYERFAPSFTSSGALQCLRNASLRALFPRVRGPVFGLELHLDMAGSVPD